MKICHNKTRHARKLRDGAIIFGQLIGKLDVLRIECAKCGQSGQYKLAVLIAKYGRNEKLFTSDQRDHRRLPAQARRQPPTTRWRRGLPGLPKVI